MSLRLMYVFTTTYTLTFCMSVIRGGDTLKSAMATHMGNEGCGAVGGVQQQTLMPVRHPGTN